MRRRLYGSALVAHPRHPRLAGEPAAGSLCFVAAPPTSGIPLLVCYFCYKNGVRKAVMSTRAVLTSKHLSYSRGNYACLCMCWQTARKDIPLDKICDVAYQQGCCERCYSVSSLNIQTAGSSGPDAGPEIVLQGLKHPERFRKALVRAINDNAARKAGGGASSAMATRAPTAAGRGDHEAKAGASESDGSPLIAARDTVVRIERILAKADARYTGM